MARGHSGKAPVCALCRTFVPSATARHCVPCYGRSRSQRSTCHAFTGELDAPCPTLNGQSGAAALDSGDRRTPDNILGCLRLVASPARRRRVCARRRTLAGLCALSAPCRAMMTVCALCFHATHITSSAVPAPPARASAHWHACGASGGGRISRLRHRDDDGMCSARMTMAHSYVALGMPRHSALLPAPGIDSLQMRPLVREMHWPVGAHLCQR